jgi:hypothetical protein
VTSFFSTFICSLFDLAGSGKTILWSVGRLPTEVEIVPDLAFFQRKYRRTPPAVIARAFRSCSILFLRPPRSEQDGFERSPDEPGT